MAWTDEKSARLDQLLKKQAQNTLTTNELAELHKLRRLVGDAFMEQLLKRAEAGWPVPTPAAIQDQHHALSRAWRWNATTRVPDLLWCCWNGPIGNPSDNEQVYVLPLIPGQPPPTSENLQTADFEDVANLYMTEQQCREANKPVYRGL